MRIFKNNAGSWLELVDILNECEPFRNTTNNFRGELVSGSISTGQMAKDDVDIMRAAEPDYVVFSYATPIGYRGKDGIWCSPSAGYSQTTKAKHLSRLRPAIGRLNGEL